MKTKVDFSLLAHSLLITRCTVERILYIAYTFTEPVGTDGVVYLSRTGVGIR